MKKDRLLLAGLIGGVCTLSGEIITTVLVALGIGEYALYELNSLIVSLGRPDIIMGFILNLVVGSVVGTVFYLLFKKYGSAHIVIKTVVGSLLLWLLYELEFTAFVETKSIPLRSSADYYVHLLGTAVYGLVVGIALKWFLFTKEDKPEEDT
jgi:hypothetical protein